MNKKRITKTIAFFILGLISFVPLIFWEDIVVSFLDAKSNLKTFNLVYKIGKAAFIILGTVLLLAGGLYNLIMIFAEEEPKES